MIKRFSPGRFSETRLLFCGLWMLSKEKFMCLFMYSWKKKDRDFTKIYAFYPFCENREKLLAFNSFWQRNPFIDAQVGSKYFFE